MDDKLSEEAKPKITRSRARHIRRKRLLSARRAAENDSSSVPNYEAEGSNDSKSSENRELTESLSKSKARRLRKKNKKESVKNSGKIVENKIDIVASPSRVSECTEKTLNEEIIISSTKGKRDDEILPVRNDIIECNSLTRSSTTVKITASEHELFENEKNLKITENSRSSFECTRRISEDYESGIITIDDAEDSSLSFIINEDSNYRIIDDVETEIFESGVISDRIEDASFLRGAIISSINDEAKYMTNNEVSLSNLPKETKNTTGRASTTSKFPQTKMNSQEKSREQVKAEREAKKLAKAAAKSKCKISKPEIVENSVSAKAKPEIGKKKINEAKIDMVDGVILPMTSKLTISETSKKKPEVAIAKSDLKIEAKSKSELRAERRAKQEAQRAAKQTTQQDQEKIKPRESSKQEITKISMMVKKIDDPAKKIVKRTVLKENAHEVNLFKHLYHEREQALINVPIVNSNIHPAIVRLGVQYANKIIVGSNARCVALLAAVKQLIKDFERPSQADFTRGLEASLQESSAHLHYCRPLAVSMQNALRHLKWQMAQLSATTSDEEAKTKLGNAIDTYIQEQIQLADKAISITIQTKISNGDVILTYGYSSLIYKILCDAHDAGRQFRVVVVDGRPWLEGREQLRRLAKHGLECSYVFINALSFIMPEVSKVFLGAHAILANGAVMSRVGTAQVALMAKSFNVPVLVACETHKTCERVQTDSIVYNEIADADELAQNLMGSSKKTSLINWRGKKSLNLLNITYDVTPADLVTAVVTELAILPCTSVPVILRIKPSEI